jgi:type I restriction enzyme S subunit
MAEDRKKLGAFFKVKHGYAFKSEFFSNSGKYVVVTPGNFFDEGGFKKKGEKEKFYTGPVPKDYVLNKGDLIVAMTEQSEGLLGSSALIPADNYYLHNQRLGLIVDLDEKRLDKKFLYYLFNLRDVRNQIRATATGAKIRHTAPERIRSVSFKYLPIEEQRRSAAILSAYDDLIENNTRRVKLLDEHRTLLFQHFIKTSGNGVATKQLGEIVDEVGSTVRTGPFGSQLHESDYTEEGVPVVMPKNIIDGRISTANIARVPHEITSKLSAHALNLGDIVYGRRGDIGRRALITKRQQGWLCGTGCLRISLSGEQLHSRFLYEFLGQPEIVSLIASRAVGATMPNLNTSILRGIPITMPPYRVQKEFAETVLPCDELIENLVEKNYLLRMQRDILLPKLISGEIDVSHFPDPEEVM